MIDHHSADRFPQAPAGRNLQPELFHGTGANLRPGIDSVLPATKHGGPSHWGNTGSDLGQPSREHAFATSNEETAWDFGTTAASVLGTRNRVYRVAPHPQMREGAHAYLDEYVAPSFKTTERLDIKPGHQGTLAGDGPEPFNWNPLRNPNSHRGWVDANHPPMPETHREAGNAEIIDEYDNPRRSNVQRFNHQADTYEKWRNEAHPTAGQGELFKEPPRANLWSDQRDRALTHMLNGLVRDRRTPGLALEEGTLFRESRQRGRSLPGARNDMRL